jgi:hypothetical protein
MLADDDLLFECMLHLDAPSLIACAQVCRGWRLLALADRCWAPICSRRWAGKHVPWSRLRELSSWSERYARAEALAAVRVLSTAEICRHTFIFSMNGRTCCFAKEGDRQFVRSEWTPELTWKWNRDNTLQIDQYPRHTVTRLPNWGWKTLNAFVSLTSAPEDAPEDLSRALADPESLPRSSSRADVASRASTDAASSD